MTALRPGLAPPYRLELAGTQEDSYLEGTVEQLFGLLLEVLRARQPEIQAVFTTGLESLDPDRELLLRGLQTQGIWLQLLNIAEENAFTRQRRRVELLAGPDEVVGSFDRVLARAAAAGVEAETIRQVLSEARIRPVITAHPTEAKRVTVLEIHRRIYRLLVQLETDRWTPRERQALIQDLGNEIDLLWLTGEIRLERPRVEQEVAWGLHFFQETLFERVPELYDKLELALRRHYPEDGIEVPAFLQFGSWIGGDRDGNPFVTNEVTRETLARCRLTALRQYRAQLDGLVRNLSIAAHGVDVPKAFLKVLAQRLDDSGKGTAPARRDHHGGGVRRGLGGLRLHRFLGLSQRRGSAGGFQGTRAGAHRFGLRRAGPRPCPAPQVDGGSLRFSHGEPRSQAEHGGDQPDPAGDLASQP
jgi:phosphoenolpyruvate carboxylase